MQKRGWEPTAGSEAGEKGDGCSHILSRSSRLPVKGESCSPFQLPAARRMSALEFAGPLLELIQLAAPVKAFADVVI